MQLESCNQFARSENYSGQLPQPGWPRPLPVCQTQLRGCSHHSQPLPKFTENRRQLCRGKLKKRTICKSQKYKLNVTTYFIVVFQPTTASSRSAASSTCLSDLITAIGDKLTHFNMSSNKMAGLPFVFKAISVRWRKDVNDIVS